jgi:hypothetical protein
MLRTIRNIALTIVVLAVIFAGAGIAYVLISGDAETQANAEQTPVAKAPDTSLPKPHTPSPNAPESAGIQSLFTPVKIGTNTSMSVGTLPGSTCTISFIYNNIASKDSGLTPKTSDNYGNVTWAWTINSDVPVGTWPVKVTCAYNKKTAVVIGNLQVTK